MKNYIDAYRLIAEINERLMAVNLEKLGNFGAHRAWAYNDVKDIIGSLQQERPEVDFETEYAKFSNDTDDLDYAFPIDLADYKYFARHFYELGLNARKEE